jgi:hypothetical protein
VGETNDEIDVDVEESYFANICSRARYIINEHKTMKKKQTPAHH